MIKKCPGCKKKKDMRPNQKYCNHKCKKTYENSLRGAKKEGSKNNEVKGFRPPSEKVNRPHGLNEIAAAYWDKIAPTIIARGHLNVLSEDAFAELCDLHSRLTDINAMINLGITQQCNGCGTVIQIPGNRSLLQVDDKWDNKQGIESQSFKESALSDLKRKYSRQFLDYCKSFYLTPLSNRGNFDLGDKKEVGKDEFFN
jgi:hypothetical protein